MVLFTRRSWWKVDGGWWITRHYIGYMGSTGHLAPREGLAVAWGLGCHHQQDCLILIDYGINFPAAHDLQNHILIYSSNYNDYSKHHSGEKA